MGAWIIETWMPIFSHNDLLAFMLYYILWPDRFNVLLLLISGKSFPGNSIAINVLREFGCSFIFPSKMPHLTTVVGETNWELERSSAPQGILVWNNDTRVTFKLVLSCSVREGESPALLETIPAALASYLADIYWAERVCSPETKAWVWDRMVDMNRESVNNTRSSFEIARVWTAAWLTCRVIAKAHSQTPG